MWTKLEENTLKTLLLSYILSHLTYTQQAKYCIIQAISSIFPEVSLLSAESNCIQFRGPEGLECRPHINSELEVICVTRGSIDVCVGRQTLHPEAGMAVLIFPYQPHSFCPQDGAQGRVYMFSLRLILDFYNTYAANGATPFCFTLSQPLWAYLSYATEAAEQQPDELPAKSLFYPLAAEYLKNVAHGTPGSPQPLLVTKVMDYILNHLQDKITLKALSSHFGINTATLSKLLREYTYCSFTDFVNNIRIEKAITLFYEQDASVTEAAYESGFGSVRNFNRVFYNTLGITPSEYRNKKR